MSKQDHTAFPSVVLPPEEWTLHHDKWGFMGRDSSPGGRLVRLADVLQHIERSQAVSRADALTTLADGLREDEGRSVFILRPGESPRQLAKNDRFGFAVQAPHTWSTQSSWVHQHASSEWLTRDAPSRHAATAPTKPNQAVRTSLDWLVERMKKDWIAKGRGQALVSLDDETKQAARFAVLMNRANELWGYGRLQPLQPPASWCLKSTFGYMACNGEPGGLLVRLYDVMTWIEEAENVPPKKAHETVEKGIGTLTNADLFELSEDDYASQFDGSEDFAPIKILGDAKDPDELGIASLKVWLSGGFCPHVAVRMVRAYALWGYGEPSAKPATTAVMADSPQPVQLEQAQALPITPALELAPFSGVSDDLRTRLGELTKQRSKKGQTKKTKGARWTDEQRVTAADVVEALDALRAGTGVKTLANALGIGRQSLESVISVDAVAKARKALNLAQAKQISPQASVFHLADAAQAKR